MATVNKTGSEYLEDMLKKKQESLRQAAQNGDIDAQAALDKAAKERQKANRAAGADYMQYINPYGVQAESLAKNKLKDSGIAESNNARAYQAYQNRTSENQSNYSDAATDVSLQKMKNSNELASSITDAESEYYDSLYDEYWKNKNFDYEKSRDALEDERYEREWAYKLASASRSSSSGGSSSRSSSKSSSSSKTYTHTPQSGLSSSGLSVQQSVARSTTQSMGYAAAIIQAREATNNGTAPASRSTAESILSAAKSRYLSTAQLDQISRYLACE